MITALRSYLSTWVVRGLFIVLIAAFAMWGVGDVLRMRGASGTWAAKVGGTTIEGAELDTAFKRQLAQVTARLGTTEVSPEIRRSVAAQTLERLIAQTLLVEEAKRMRLAVPDDFLVRAVYQMPAFHGPNGQFDRRQFEQVLRSNGLSEAAFLDLLRTDLLQRQLVEAVRAGATSPDILTRSVFAVEEEQRSADMVELPFADAEPPAAPDAATLRRWWENHPDDYRSPEYRRIKAVILSPQTLAKDIEVSDDDLRASYEANKSEYVTPAKRSAQIISVADEAKAATLAATWQGGADWTRMQQEAQAQGGTAVELDSATRAEFPAPELGQAVFVTAPNSVGAPVRTPLGWSVVRVTTITPGSEKRFDEVKDALRDRVLAEKAADLMYDRANKVDNALGSGASLDALPGDLGLGAVTGTLDANGNTMQGEPAPLPGSDELRRAIIAAAFQAQKDEPPRLTEVQTPSTGGSAYFALQVEDVIPAAQKPFEAVQDQVKADWTHDAIRHEQEAAAAALLAAVKGGETLETAAARAGLHLRRTPRTSRAAPAEGVPPALIGPLFAAKKGEPTEADTADGFIVAVPAEIVQPDPKADPVGYKRVRDALTRSIANDIELAYVRGLRNRVQPQINQAVLDHIAQP